MRKWKRLWGPVLLLAVVITGCQHSRNIPRPGRRVASRSLHYYQVVSAKPVLPPSHVVTAPSPTLLLPPPSLVASPVFEGSPVHDPKPEPAASAVIKQEQSGSPYNYTDFVRLEGNLRQEKGAWIIDYEVPHPKGWRRESVILVQTPVLDRYCDGDAVIVRGSLIPHREEKQTSFYRLDSIHPRSSWQSVDSSRERYLVSTPRAQKKLTEDSDHSQELNEIAYPGQTEAQEPANYDAMTTLRGRLQRFNGSWRIRYLPLDRTDEQGGSVVLTGFERLEGYSEGDMIQVSGKVIVAASAGREALYLVDSIEKVE